MEHAALSPLRTIETIALSLEWSDAEQVQRIQEVLTDRSAQRHTVQTQLHTFQAQTQGEAEDADYDAVRAAQSRKLQNRLTNLVRVLAFQGEETSALMVAIVHYKTKEGQITQIAPLDFLEPQEQYAVLDDAGTLRVSLYKALLFIKVAEAIKGGVLNFRHSYKYRS